MNCYDVYLQERERSFKSNHHHLAPTEMSRVFVITIEYTLCCVMMLNNFLHFFIFFFSLFEGRRKTMQSLKHFWWGDEGFMFHSKLWTFKFLPLLRLFSWLPPASRRNGDKKLEAHFFSLSEDDDREKGRRKMCAEIVSKMRAYTTKHHSNRSHKNSAKSGENIFSVLFLAQMRTSFFVF